MAVGAPRRPNEEAGEERTRGGRSRAVRWILGILALLTAGVVAVVGFFAWSTWSLLNSVQRDDLLPEEVSRPAAVTTAAAGTSLNFILMGSDSRGAGDQGRSDVLMLAHVPPTRDKVYLISFPRDLWVNVPGRGMAKINAAYAWGGPRLTAQTLESLVGVRMDHAAQIDFEGFVGLTDQLGGVTVDNKVASTQGEYHWAQGAITISGAEALAYVRQRYELPNGDLDRAERQRAVVRAILQKLMGLDLLTDPARFKDVVGRLAPFVIVDKAFTNDVIFSTATSLKVRSAADVVLLQAPISGFGRSSDGQSIDLVNAAQFAELADALQTGRVADYYARYKDQPLAGAKG